MTDKGSSSPHRFSRRVFLRATGAGATALTLASLGGTAQAAENIVVAENQLAGSEGWKIGVSPYMIANDTSQQIKGYASATSVNRGQSIRFFVTVNPAPQTYSIDIYRIGWYGGKGGRLKRRVASLAGKNQGTCPMNSSTCLRECRWSTSYTLAVPSWWTSGIYVAVLTNANNYQNYIIFVVRDDASTSAILYQQPVLNYQAYNNFPDNGINGKSLYPGPSQGANTITGTQRAVKVSFDRPYRGPGAGEFFAWEVHTVHWLERNGYDVSYSTSIDTHAAPGRMNNHKLWLTSGHDEYWSKRMYDGARAARGQGRHLMFWGTNDLYWQVRMEPNSAGVANRTVVCYKDKALDPHPDQALQTIRWRDLGRPEQETIGIMFTGIMKVAIDGGKPYTVTNPGHWAYAGTGFVAGDQVAHLLCPEGDRLVAGLAKPAYKSYTKLSETAYTTTTGRSDIAQSSIYQSTSGAWVFASGTWRWSWGLDRPGYIDARIQKTTVNLLYRTTGTMPVTSSTASSTSTRSTAQDGPTGAGIYSKSIDASGPLFAEPDHD